MNTKLACQWIVDTGMDTLCVLLASVGEKNQVRPVNGGVKTCHRGGAKAGQLVARLGA